MSKIQLNKTETKIWESYCDSAEAITGRRPTLDDDDAREIVRELRRGLQRESMRRKQGRAKKMLPPDDKRHGPEPG